MTSRALKSITLAREMATYRLPACRLGNGPASGPASLASVAVRLVHAQVILDRREGIHKSLSQENFFKILVDISI